MRRKTDSAERNVFRTDRYFQSEGLWYFATREGIDFGPFTSRLEGKKAASRYIDTQSAMQRLRTRDPTITKESQWDDQSVARAARDVLNWRLDRSTRPDSQYADRAGKRR